VKTVSAISKQDLPVVQRTMVRAPHHMEGRKDETLALPPKSKFAEDEVVLVQVPDGE